MNKLQKILASLLLAFGFTFLVAPTAYAVVENSPVGISQNVQATTTDPPKVEDPGVVETYGPTTVIIGIILGGIERIIAAFRKFKEINLESAQRMAESAKTELSEERERYKKEKEELERERDLANEQRHTAFKRLDEKKNEHAEEILKKDREHSARIREHLEEDRIQAEKDKKREQALHDVSTALLYALRDRETRLAEKGIWYPKDPPPITEKMMQMVKPSDHREIDRAVEDAEIVNDELEEGDSN